MHTTPFRGSCPIAIRGIGVVGSVATMVEYVSVAIGSSSVSIGEGGSIRIGTFFLLPLQLGRLHSLLTALLLRQHLPLGDGFGDSLEGSRRKWLLQNISRHIGSSQSVLDDVCSDLFFVISDTKSEWTLADEK